MCTLSHLEPTNLMNRLKIITAACVLTFSIGCDQVTKIAAREHLQGEQMQSFLGDTFRLTYAENSGAFLSLGASLPDTWRTLIFVVFVSVFLLGFLVWMFRAKNVSMWTIIASTLIVGGGVGNLIDRIAFDGRVTDFLNMGIGSLRTGIFNVADIWIMVGAALMIILSFRGDHDQKSTEPGGTEAIEDASTPTQSS